MIVSEPAVWKADESELRLLPVEKPTREEAGGGYTYSVDGTHRRVNSWPDRETAYEYFTDGNTLTLRLLRSGEPDVGTNEKMVLTRKAGL